MFVNPSFENAFQFGKIYNSANFIYFVARYKEIRNVIVSVKELTFSAVSAQAVPSAKT
jgi:hypothetical protein